MRRHIYAILACPLLDKKFAHPARFLCTDLSVGLSTGVENEVILNGTTAEDGGGL